MCGRYVSPEQASIERAWQVRKSSGLSFPRRFNVQPTTDVPLLMLDAGELSLVAARWGLIPHWWEQDKPPTFTINARLEEAAGKPMWRDPMRPRAACSRPRAGTNGRNSPAASSPTSSRAKIAGRSASQA